MKTFLSILIIFISLQSWTKANDISEFEIEGISVGDSLNKFFNEKEISDAVDESYEDKTYITKTFYEINLKNYEAIQATFKAKDKKRIIVSIVGVIGYPNNIPDCKKEMNNIDIELINLFPKAMRKDWGKYEHNMENMGHYFPITYDFEDGSGAMVSCHDWSEQSGIEDNLKVSIFEGNYANYIKRKN